ncbi:MAG: hypothetical protein J7501_14605 [Bdellovibrio sp.]|nr:hypothetical protein [Bdellovibrio sp.]
MNRLALGTILISILSTLSISAHADTELILAAPAIEISGSAPAKMAIAALMVYTPELKSNPDMSQCYFPEDKYSPNGNEVLRSFDAQQTADGKYSLNVPMRGLRKNCKYVFSHIYLTYDKGIVYQPITLKTDSQVALENSWGEEAGIDPIFYSRFSDQKSMSCDFKEYGLCHINGALADLYYSIPDGEQHITFDVMEETSAN